MDIWKHIESLEEKERRRNRTPEQAEAEFNAMVEAMKKNDPDGSKSLALAEKYSRKKTIDKCIGCFYEEKVDGTFIAYCIEHNNPPLLWENGKCSSYKKRKL